MTVTIHHRKTFYYLYFHITQTCIQFILIIIVFHNFHNFDYIFCLSG